MKMEGMREREGEAVREGDKYTGIVYNTIPHHEAVSLSSCVSVLYW